VGWASLFPVDRSPCPMLSAMVSQVLTPRDHDFSSGLWPDNRSAPDRSCMWNAPRVFSYETISNWNLFSETLYYTRVSKLSQPVGIVTVRQAEQPKISGPIYRRDDIYFFSKATRPALGATKPSV
jgi:hypothetical protein